MTVQSEFLQEMQSRGFVHQCTDLIELDKSALDDKPLTIYIGFDATAKSLHVGNLVQIMALRRLQQSGHKPIILMGGGTTKVGDPSGKDEMRRVLTDADIEENIQNIRRVFEKYVTFGDGPTDAIMLNNDSWLSELNYLEFLRDYGKHFTINRMMTFESVKSRLEREQPLSFLEFNYMILQAYDFYHLNKKYGCSVEIGGSDQWGNIVNGVELTRRVSKNTVYGLTTPLITTSSGAKMGKTAKGAVWLDPQQLPTYDFWQFWRNTEDADVGKFLRLFTDLPVSEIQNLEKAQGAEINEVKKQLANETTKMAHGEEALNAVLKTVASLYEGNATQDYRIVNRAIESALPIVTVPKDDFNDTMPVVDLFTLSGLAKSKGEVRRLIKGSGAKLNDAVIADDSATISASDFNEDNVLKLSFGKKKHALIHLN